MGIGILFLAAVALIVYGVGLRISKPRAKAEVETGVKVSKSAGKGVAKTSGERLAFIAQFGWEVAEEPVEVAEIVIPEEFDEVYEEYNTLQKKQSYDLEKLKGKRCKRYTYQITNYPECPDNARMNLLVADGRVVGGDVCSVELAGFMHGFAADSAVMAQGQALPLPETEETAVVEQAVGGLQSELEEAEAEVEASEEPIDETMASDLAEMEKALQAEQ